MGKLFGSSGVRGLVNLALTPKLAYEVGIAASTLVKARRALVGRDTRVSGQMLEDALVSGLVASGANVSLLGMVPTPAVAYLTKRLDADVGFMLTASHNPPQYNGIKVFGKDSLAFSDVNQDAVEKIIFNNNYALAGWRKLGETNKDYSESLYVEMLTKSAKLHKRWRVVVDPGCGATYNVVPLTLKAHNCKITALNAQPDGYFPAHPSEPDEESLIDLAKTVQGLGADLGIAFDGDGDRAAFVDEEGTFVDFDRILSAFSAYVLKKSGSGTIVTNVEASMCLETMAQRNNGRVFRTKVGDVYVSEAMARLKAVFGGEPCGAWIHPQYHWCPDGPLSAVLVLQALEKEDKSLKEFVAEVPKYVTLRKNIKCRNEEKQKIISFIEKELPAAFHNYIDISVVDGVRLALSEGWLLIRASGTEPLIRLTVEGKSLKTAKHIMKKGISLVQEQLGDAKA